jgi:hypothetical protein
MAKFRKHGVTVCVFIRISLITLVCSSLFNWFDVLTGGPLLILISKSVYCSLVVINVIALGARAP